MLSGLKYLHVVRRAGLPVDRMEEMIGSYPPRGEPYVKRFAPSEAPSGMLARSGTNSVRSRIIDDDGVVYADFSWSFKVRDVSNPARQGVRGWFLVHGGLAIVYIGPIKYIHVAWDSALALRWTMRLRAWRISWALRSFRAASRSFACAFQSTAGVGGDALLAGAMPASSFCTRSSSL